MASTDKLIRIILKLEDQMSKGLDGASDSLGKMSDKMKSVGMGMTASITAPVVAAGVGIFKTFADYENVMVEMQARTGATAEEMAKMGDIAKQMGRDTVFSATDAAQAMLELTSSGSSAAEAMEQLPHVLNLAAAGSLELGRAADGVTDVLAMFQLEAEEAVFVANNLALAAGSSSATISDLLEGFSNVGPVAAQFGMHVGETAAALAVLSENGIKGAEAGTQLRSMLLNMSRDTNSVRDAWRDLGISMYDSAGNMRDIDELFKDINVAMKDMSMEEQNRIAADLAGSFGVVGFNAIRAANGIGDMHEKMMGAANAGAVARARMNTLSGRFTSLIGSVETLAITLGGLGEGPISALIEWATKIVNGFAAWAEANPVLAQSLMVLAAALAAVGPAMIIIAQLISAFTTIAAVLPVLAVGFGAISAPILAAVAAIVALGIAVSLLAKNWKAMKTVVLKGLTDFTKNLGDRLRRGAEVFAEFAQKLPETFKMLPTVLMKIGEEILKGLIVGILSKANEFVMTVRKMASDAANAVRNAFKIKSPSKVMEGIGHQVVEGFNQGIESFGGIGVNVPSVTGGNSANPSIGLSPAAVGGGGNVIVQNLNVPPGTTKEQIDIILKEIGKAAKRNGARGSLF